MSVKKQEHTMQFSHLQNTGIFATITTLYSRSDGEEDPKEYYFQKIGRSKAITLDKRTIVHFLPNDRVNPCIIEHKEMFKRA